MKLRFCREGPRPSPPGGPVDGPLKGPPLSIGIAKRSVVGAFAFCVLFSFEHAYTPGAAAPVPVPPAPPDAPSVPYFNEQQQEHQHESPRLLLMHDFSLGNDKDGEAINWAREMYPTLLTYIEGAGRDRASFSVLPVSSFFTLVQTLLHVEHFFFL